jgi:hypothetical protein
VRNNALLRAIRGQPESDARDVFDHTCADLDQTLPDRRELGYRERISLWNCGAHAMHEPERCSMKDERDLIGVAL